MLYGRERERSRIGGLLDRARESRSGVLVLRGEAGAGKSALLEDAREHASDMQILAATGVESEAALPFAGLHQLVRPILGCLDHLPEPQVHALGTALGLVAGGPPDRFLVSLAVLSLLAEAAERRPLLCLIDDAHWLDDASVDALVFPARRLEAEAIVMLFAAREREVRRFDALPELEVGGLSPTAAAELLEQVAGVTLSPAASERLIERTAGNPLALMELPRVLSEDQLGGAEPLVAPVPTSSRIEKAYVSLIRRLPEDTQTLLLLAASEDSGDLATVLRASSRLGLAAEALDPAEHAGLVRVRRTRLEMRHPLVRSAIYHRAPLSQRRAAHRALASVLDDDAQADQRAWHWAAASIEPDPTVVAELEQAAHRAQARSGFAAASVALERAAALTADSRQRARQLTAAAENAWLGGRPERATMLLEPARRMTSDPVQRADIDQLLGVTEMTTGVPAQACEVLLRAAEEVATLDADRALQLLNIASVAAVYAGDWEAGVAIAKLAKRLDLPGSRASMEVSLLSGLGAHFQGDFATAATQLRAALPLEGEAELETADQQPLSILWVARAAIFLGDDPEVHRLHHVAMARAREAGSLSLLAQILPRLGDSELWAGRWASAAANASEGLRFARETGQHNLVAYGLVLQAVIAAHRGADHECRSLAVEAMDLASNRRFALVTEFGNWALTLLELGQGRTAEALARARGISISGAVYWSALDRIEAAVRAGEPDTACDWLAAFEPWALTGGAAWARAQVLHCRALLCDDDRQAESLFRAALAAHADAARPFGGARTNLAFGEWLRRSRRRVQARHHLSAALDAFERLGAEDWTGRARAELRASGQTARRRQADTRDQLTAQELQIAALVAKGLANREAAAQMFLSPRTIDFHLRNIFRKLDITSRTQLAQVDLHEAAGGKLVAPVSSTTRE